MLKKNQIVKFILAHILLSIFTIECTAQHFIAKRDRSSHLILEGFLSDDLNRILNTLDVIEVWIDIDKQTYKIQSKKSDFKISGRYYAYDGGTAGYRYYCYYGNTKQKITLATVRCALLPSECRGRKESLEIYGGDDFNVNFIITQWL